MNQYEEQDNKVRDKFILEFQPFILAVKKKPIECPYDLDLTGTTGVVYHIELKERTSDYPISKLQYDTYMEDLKQAEFRRLYEQFPEDRLMYFNYSNDGYISFNIGSRIEDKSIQLNLYRKKLSANNYTNAMKNKMISSLKFTPEYGDKICYYSNTTNLK